MQFKYVIWFMFTPHRHSNFVSVTSMIHIEGMMGIWIYLKPFISSFLTSDLNIGSELHKITGRETLKKLGFLLYSSLIRQRRIGLSEGPELCYTFKYVNLQNAVIKITEEKEFKV